MKQVTTRISDDLHRKVRIKAFQKGKTITEIIREKLEEWVEDNDDSPEEDEDT